LLDEEFEEIEFTIDEAHEVKALPFVFINASNIRSEWLKEGNRYILRNCG